MALDTLPAWLPLILLAVPLLLLLKRNKGKLPPGPPRLPILGNLHQLSALPHQSLRELSKKYGPVMLLHLGRIPTVVISSAEAAQEVLKTHDLACCSRPRLEGVGRLTYNYLDVAFTPYSEHWRSMRKVTVLELFSLKRVQSFRSLREEEVQLMIDSISDSAAKGTPVDITEKSFALSAHITFRMSFGFNYRGSDFDQNRFHEVVHDTADIMGKISANEFFPYFGWILDRITGYHGRVERTFREIDKFFQHVVDDHLKAGRNKDHYDMIDVLLKIKDEKIKHGVPGISINNVKGVLLNLFLGGIDTSANTVNWAMAELSRNPRVMKKAQDEVRRCVGNKGRVTEDDLEKLQFLKMVAKEALRLYPPVPLLVTREVISPCNVDGYDINPGMLVQINVWALGRDPKYWKDPEEFIPERFTDGTVDFKGQNFEFLPFGSGRRMCPGIAMAMTSVELSLANLLYCFDWKLPNGMKQEEVKMEELSGVSLVLTTKDPVVLVPVKYVP